MDRRPPSGGRREMPPPAGRFSAARSHVMNDKYMEDFERAWEEMHALQIGGGGGGGAAAGRAGGGGSGGSGGGGSGGGGSGRFSPARMAAIGGAMAGPRAGGGGGSSGGAASLAAQQRAMYAALEEPSTSSLSYTPYGTAPGAGPSGRPSSRGSSRVSASGPSPSPSRGASARSTATPTGILHNRHSPPSPAAAAAGPPSSIRRPPSTAGGAAAPPRRPSSASGGAGGAAAAAAGGGGAGGGAAGGLGWPPCRYPGRVVMGWSRGPADPAGVLADLSDRPNTCCAADWGRGEVVVGSTDHALYVVDAARGLRKRTLYSKACGHKEWVSCVTYCPDGRIVSGGMDSKLWVWPAGGTRGMEAEGHFGPISQVKYDMCTGLVASASYDKTLRLWQLGARPHEVACLQGHDAPVLEMQISADGLIVSGDRSGHILLWDTSAAASSWRMRNVHSGHVTSLAWFDDTAGGGGDGGDGGGGGGGGLGGCFVSGGQDGVVRVWDPRARTNVAKVQLHVNEQGRGAVGDIIAGGAATGGMLLTAGADGTARVCDPRAGFAAVHAVRLTDFPYSMTAAGGLAVVGCGDGSIHFIDISRGRTLYALGANRAAVRCLEATHDRLLASGDDGKAVLYTFT